MKTLNLGSGNDYLDGAVNVDFYSVKADIRHDLESMPYPFADDTFDAIRCMNVLEHLHEPIRVMQELHRIGRHGARVIIRVPHFRSAALYEDITHQRGYAWRTLDHFVTDGEIYGDYTSRGFVMIDRQYTPYLIPFLYRLLSKVPRLTDNLLSKFIPMASILFTLEVRKHLGRPD
ncbi:SAM-dependent methyltransferase [Luteibacter sp. HA06]|jgi:SAM-dependent methyltransferase